MLVHRKSIVNRRKRSYKNGSGLVNDLVDKLPFELHLPGYQYCGPGTQLQKRLKKGQLGVNDLDKKCLAHDIQYQKSSDLKDRHKADYQLEQSAWERVKSKDASLGEKAAAWVVTNIMKAKRKLGMGLRKKLKKGIKKRIIPVPKNGGFLPLLLPILGALGALGGGAAGIAKAINDAKTNKQQLAEQQRHNLAMEQVGKGLRLNKKGKGLFLAPYKKNSQ
uniref:Phospholipase A2-like domain-containing protein n=1 Tax=Anoplophora glabripennis TaxID=217634 RepID=V5G499_ANOGL